MQKKIMLAMAGILFLLAFIAPRNFVISGKVTDTQGNPVPFATVKVKGSRTAVSADASGNFSILVQGESAVLEISGTGFSMVTAAVTSKQKSITVVLNPSAVNDLKEVVVTGAYNVKRIMRSVTVNQQTVSGYYLAGKVPGVQVRTPNGMPGKPKDEYNREGYDYIAENTFLKTKDNPLSTFSIDVDAASYSNVRRMLNDGQLPPAGAVRIEEMINYFSYQYPQPAADKPFSVNTEISDCPWNPRHRLALVGLQGKKIPVEQLPPANLVFLIDVSGSMQGPDRLDLVKASMKLLADQLREQDKVSICVYAGSAGLVLPPTNGLQKQKIKEALNALEAGGSTAGGAGIQLAYNTARANFVKGGNNRVILCTDGDFNVGMSSDDALERLIEEERKSGVFLTVLGYGMGNYQDAKMQKLADKGNGNHAYIDQLNEAKKVLVSEFGGTLFTIAKDVKLQVEFNPAIVQGYRLIGYENRMLNKEDFNDDKKDAGEMGSGHTVTALYEIIPVGEQSEFLRKVDTLKYQSDPSFNKSAFNAEMMTVKFRYKQPDGNVSQLMEVPVMDKQTALQATSDNFRFAAAVAQMGLLLRNSSFKQQASYTSVLSLANGAIGTDKEGYRKEFVQLTQSAMTIAKKTPPAKSSEAKSEVEDVSKNR
jgi:Ca-activated chloride channel family protein